MNGIISVCKIHANKSGNIDDTKINACRKLGNWYKNKKIFLPNFKLQKHSYTHTYIYVVIVCVIFVEKDKIRVNNQ